MIQLDMVFTLEKNIILIFWIIHCQSPTNLPKSMWKLVFNVADVIFKFGNPEKKIHKVHMNNDPCKAFKNICFWDKGIEK
jgi:uncharacterized protein YukJ